MKDNCIALFLKSPENLPTELCAKYGAEKAHQIYIEAAKALFKRLDNLPDAQLACVYAASPKHRDLRWLDDCDPGFLQLRAEYDEDDAYFNALNWCFRAGAKKVVDVSVMTPHLDTETILKAFTLLRDKQIVIGGDNTKEPYIFGMKDTYRQALDGYPWRGYPLYEKLFEHIKNSRLSYHEMPQLSSIITDEGYSQWQTLENKTAPKAECEKPQENQEPQPSPKDSARTKPQKAKN